MNHLLRGGLALLVAGAVMIESHALALHGGSDSPRPRPGTERSFLPDPHQGGQATSLRLVEAAWGRLVDVHALDFQGHVDPQPALREMLINENVLTDGVNYRLEKNPVTQLERLVILRRRTDPEFELLLRAAESNLVPILPKAQDALPPFSILPRNATLMLRFDDLLADGPQMAGLLQQHVRVLVGNPALVPFTARILFDRNHGGVVNGRMHATRVLVDFTVTAVESSPTPLPLNGIGLPPSAQVPASNVVLRLPTQVNPGVGQFTVLTNLSGATLGQNNNGPIDANSPTLDLVRAMRSGNGTDSNNGFLLDLVAPEVLGSWPVRILRARPAPGGIAFREFLVDLMFLTACQAAPRQADVLQLGAALVEVLAPGADPGPLGIVTSVRVLVLGADDGARRPIARQGLYLSAFDPASTAAGACWVSFQPAADPTGTGVSPDTLVSARFSESMDIGSLSDFDDFFIGRGAEARGDLAAEDIVPGFVLPSADLSEFAYAPTLPLTHVQGSAESYHVFLGGGARDLAGNELAGFPGVLPFTLVANAPDQATDGLVLRFNEVDEYRRTSAFGSASGKPDWRGQFFYDLARGVMRARPVTRTSFSIDETNPVPSLQIPFPIGTQLPLNPLGAKVQTVWRYADAGLLVTDESAYNVDVEGLNWRPTAGQVVADFFEEFEIALSHSARLPDEHIDFNLLPTHPASGLLPSTSPFTDNSLEGLTVVHNRSLGYMISPIDLFVGASGSLLIPFPWNRSGAPRTTFLWRDTGNAAQAGDSSAGIPQLIETEFPLELYGPDVDAGDVALPARVPTIGLPLLMEFRCFPSDTGIGLNALDSSLAINSSALPSFRSFSAGGINMAGQVVTKDPDLELFPTGGFNPFGGGTPSRPQDNINYRGQMDVVIRVSRAHSVFFAFDGPQRFVDPILVRADHHAGAQVVADFRGALSFNNSAVNNDAVFNAGNIDPYGDPDRGRARYPMGDASFSGDVSSLEDTPFLQVRLTFVNDVDAGLSPEITALGIAGFDAP